MKLQIYPRGIYQVLRIEEDLDVIAELTELQILIEGYLEKGKRYIAVSFSNASYIYSGAIAVLIACYKKIKDGRGELCIIEPKKEIKSMFNYMGIDKIMPIYNSESELPDS